MRKALPPEKVMSFRRYCWPSLALAETETACCLADLPERGDVDLVNCRLEVAALFKGIEYALPDLLTLTSEAAATLHFRGDGQQIGG